MTDRPTRRSDIHPSPVPEGHGWTHWPAPAKLNLFLRITGRRRDGYHHLQTVFRLLDWCDTVHLRVRDDAAIVRTGLRMHGPPSVPEQAIAPQDDLTVRAATLLQRASGCGKGVDIVVDKHIPLGGGFGGGSSDAATVLMALNRLWGTGLSHEALATLALRLGADVPVFVLGRSAWAEGVGEVLRPIALPPAWYLIVTPPIHVSTTALFADPDLTRDSPPATMDAFMSGAVSDNAFEPVLRRREPEVDRVFRALQPLGRVQLTGTGSGCFIAFATRQAAEAALAALPHGLAGRLAAGVPCSPLLQALDMAEAGASAPASAATDNPGASPSG